MSTVNDYAENSHDPLCAKYISGDDLPCICDLLAEHAQIIRADEREREVAVLAAMTRWKAEATAVIKEWEQVHQLLGEPGRLGESKSSATYSRVRDLLEADS